MAEATDKLANSRSRSAVGMSYPRGLVVVRDGRSLQTDAASAGESVPACRGSQLVQPDVAILDGSSSECSLCARRATGTGVLFPDSL